MPDNHAYQAQDAQEIINNVLLKRALACLSVPMSFSYNVAIKLQAAGLLENIPGEGVQLIEWLDGAGAREMLDAAEESQKRAKQLKTETEESPHLDPEDPNKTLVPWLAKIREWQSLQNLARLTYYAVCMRAQLMPKISNVLDLIKPETMEVAEKEIETLEQMMTTTVVENMNLIPTIVEELEDPQYWNVPGADLFAPATVEEYTGTWWSYAVERSIQRKESPAEDPAPVIVEDIQETSLPAAIDREDIERRLMTSRFPVEAAYAKDVVTNTLLGRTAPPAKGRKAPLPKVNITQDSLPPGVSISRAFTAIDDDIYRGMNTLIYDGTEVFTADMIYKAMTGNPNAIATEETKREIDESWIRFTSTWVEIDTAAVSAAYPGTTVTTSDRAHMIEGVSREITISNQHGEYRTKVYKVTGVPILMEYAQSLSQINRFSIKLLDAPINKTADIRHVRNLLLDRIHTEDLPDTIRYDYLFAYLDKANLTADQRVRKERSLRGSIKKMLDYWATCPDSPLIGWTENRKGRTPVSVTISRRRKRKEMEG